MINCWKRETSKWVGLKVSNSKSSGEILNRKDREMKTSSDNVVVIKEINDVMTTERNEEGNVLTKRLKTSEREEEQNVFFEALRKKANWD